tara:strand:+ start:194 stop:616 length:423 start_codon:yes stop_codon:yes gene_type:complete
MIVLNRDLWEKDRILKLTSSDSWEDPEVHLINNCILNEIKELITQAIETNRPGVLYFDFTKGEFPPLTEAMKFAKFMVTIKSLITEGIEFTILYIVNTTHKDFVNNILKVYKPAKPVHILQDKKNIRTLLHSRSTMVVAV